MDWQKCSESFIHIVNNQSFIKAARERFTSRSALSKHVSWLESQLGVQLLQRTTRHLELTEDGKLFYNQAKQLLEDWQNLKESFSNKSNDPRGTLNVGLAVILGNHYIIPLLPELLKQFPYLIINTKTITYPSAINLNEMDIFITNEPPECFTESLDHRLLDKYHLHVYGAPSYLKKYGSPQHPQELKKHNCLLYSRTNYLNRWEFEDHTVQVQGNLITDNAGTLIKAAVSGLGLIFIGHHATVNEPQGALSAVLPKFKSPELPIYAYYPKRRKLPQKTERFLNYIEAHLNVNQTLNT